MMQISLQGAERRLDTDLEAPASSNEKSSPKMCVG